MLCIWWDVSKQNIQLSKTKVTEIKKRTFLIQFVPAQLQALKQGFVLVGQFMFLRHQEAN